MSTPDAIRARRRTIGADPAHLAAVLGISVAGYYDLESYDDEVWLLTVAELMRLCAVFGVAPAELELDLQPAGTAADAGGSLVAPPLPGAGHAPSHVTQCAGVGAAAVVAGRGSCGGMDMRAVAVAAGWDPDVVTEWMADDFAMAAMPLAALRDVCVQIGMSITTPLDIYWRVTRGPSAGSR